MKIHVIIVTYNAMQWAERCFNSLRSSGIIPDVFVVDNGSTDGTQAYIMEHFPEVKLHQSKENLGFGRANNIGLQYALDHNYDYVYLLNQDAWVMPDTFEKLIDISRKNPEYGILSPFQMNADLIHIDRNFVAHVLAWKSNPDIVSDLYNQQFKDVYPVEWVMAAHWFLPISTIKKVGGFSPSFPHYGEDDNYSVRLFYRNLKIGVTPKLRVVHDRGWRQDSSAKSIYLSYTCSIGKMSDPRTTFVKGLGKVCYLTLRSMVIYQSLRPLANLLKIIVSLPCIIRNKHISMTHEGAFLHI